MGQYTIKNVESRAEVLKNDIDNIYRALHTKIGGSPETLDQVPQYILDIPKAPTEEPLTITPTIDGQEFYADSDIKYNPITVEPVTSAIDGNIQPENIKEGISILGVGGTYKGEKPEESFDVQPTTAEQIITPTEGSVFSGGTVRAVTSAIDSNIQPENIKEGVSILGVAGTLSSGGGSDVFVVPNGVKFGNSTFTEVPSNFDFSNVTDMSNMFYTCKQLTSIPQLDTSKVTDMSNMLSGTQLTTIPQLDTSKVTNMHSMFANCKQLTTIPLLDTSMVTDMGQMFSGCSNLTTIPQLDTSDVTNMSDLFYYCSKLTTIPQLDTSKVTNMSNIFAFCSKLTTVEGIDFSGFTLPITQLFGNNSNKSDIKRFIVNGKINVSITNNYSIKALTAIDYDSVKSILAAADRTDNTNAKRLYFNRTMADQNGELAALVSSCSTKGWTITGLTLQ